MIKPGIYKAAVVSHAISETKDGNPQATITFSLQTREGSSSITWFGSFKEKAAPHTIKALLVCGLKGSNPAGPLEIGKEVSITVEDETGQDGKIRTRVKWINPIGGVVRNVMDQGLAQSKLAALSGAVMAARQEHNLPEDSDVIPF